MTLRGFGRTAGSQGQQTPHTERAAARTMGYRPRNKQTDPEPVATSINDEVPAFLRTGDGVVVEMPPTDMPFGYRPRR